MANSEMIPEVKEPKKVTVPTLQRFMGSARLITMTTAYTWPDALILDQEGIDILLVGDSLGPNILGLSSTIPITVSQILHHLCAVRAACSRALLLADMPFLEYEWDAEVCFRACKTFLKEGGAEGVKLEGGRRLGAIVRRIVDAQIPVMGHLGLTPQSVLAEGGYRVAGKTQCLIDSLWADIEHLWESGVFALLLECVPEEIATEITKASPVPIIGLGSGIHVHGQGLVHSDLLGLPTRLPKRPSFAKVYCDSNQVWRDAVRSFVADVQGRSFPSEQNTYRMAAGLDARNPRDRNRHAK